MYHRALFAETIYGQNVVGLVFVFYGEQLTALGQVNN